MISKINRLRAKKGFTMIEMIVIIAIIGILTSIVVATMSYDGKPTLGKGLAKDLYYIAQGAASDSEVANPLALSTVSSGNRAGFYVEIDELGEITDVGHMNVGPFDHTKRPDLSFASSSLTDFTAIKHDRTADDDYLCLEKRMIETMQAYLNKEDSMAGTYYVVLDSNFRVVASYWSDSPRMSLGAGPLENDCLLDTGYYCCSFPTKYCVGGQFMFGF